jgi:alpha-L-rhamnosidase
MIFWSSFIKSIRLPRQLPLKEKIFFLQPTRTLCHLVIFLGLNQTLFGAVIATNLVCGFSANPLGVDDSSPRLNWQLQTTSNGERAQSQTAYQILVASSSSALANDQGDLWDSGKILSNLPNALYGGAVLNSAQKVFWKIRIWDKNDPVSSWSPVATWTMGLLNQSDWQGGWLVTTNGSSFNLTGCNWIWYPEGNPASSAPVATRYFRKSVFIRADSALTSATLLLAADNSYVAYVNGTNVGQGSGYTVANPFNVITQLQSGANILAIAASNGGTSANAAGLIGKLILKYADGTQTNIQMDATWKSAKTLQANWQLPSFNDSSWSSALVLGAFGISPWGTGVTVQTGLPIFRRQFSVNPGLQHAVIFICGLGQYELSANGAKAGNVLLAPGWTKYDKTCLYDTLDLTSYLTNGNNAVGVMLGNGMYNVQASSRYTKFTGSFGPPKVIAQIHLFYTNGTSQIIASDSSWLTTSGPITFSSVYGGEDHDARLLPAGWNQTGFNATNWSPAVVTNGPGGTLRGQSHAAPPIVATQTLQPIKTNNFSSSTVVYDLGQNAALIPTLMAHGEPGASIQITPAELTNSDGTVNRGSVGGGSAYLKYTLAGSGTETWTPRFFYHGCRYLQVVLSAAPGSSSLPVVDSLSGVVIQAATANVGDFSCSNDLFNRTRTLIRWAQRNNLISLLTDCPHRERLGWLEQYNLHGPSLRYEFDVGQLFAKTMQDMADSQTASGLQPSIAPEYVVFGGGFRDSPEWGSSVIIVPWQHYLFTGDDTLLRNYYSTMTNYFGYLKNQAVNNFLNYPSGLGDWYDIGPNAPGYSQLTPVSLTADAYYCLDAQILARVATVLGKTAEASQFNSLATNIAAAFNSTYYSAGNGYYSTGSQTAQSMPLALGMVDSNKQASVTAALVANVYSQGLTAGDIGHRYLLRALADMGRSDVVFDLHSGTNAAGYGYILNQGATALTEAWDANTSSSQDHFMLGHITEWFYHDLAGIQSDDTAPGFQRVIIKPAFVGGITSVNASYNSVRGMIASSWTCSNNQATLNVTIPVGSTGMIYLPVLGNVTTNLLVKESGATIWQNGAANGGAAGVAFDHTQGSGSQTYSVWTIGSGSYQFVWNVLTAPIGLHASAGNARVILGWNSTPNVTGYNVKRSTTSGGSYTLIASGVTDTNFTDVGLANNTNYFYVVSAISAGGESANSAEVSATPASILNFGFETPSVGTYQYNPSGGIWTFSAQSGANGSGISANGSAFTIGNPSAPQGFQVAFIQGTGSISQILIGLIAGAIYQVTLAAAQRNNIYGAQTGQTWQLKVGGTTIGTFAPPQLATNYTTYSGTFSPSSAGSHTLAFVGSNANGGDNTVFIDNVQLSFAPVLASPNLGGQLVNRQIQIFWPADHTGWRLQMQTNTLIGTNWMTVLGSMLTNQFVSPVDFASGSVFFRLAYP